MTFKYAIKRKDINIPDALLRAYLTRTQGKKEGNIVQDMMCIISISKDKYSPKLR